MPLSDSIILGLQILKNYGLVSITLAHGILIARPDDITAIIKSNDAISLRNLGWYDGDGAWHLKG